MDNYSHHVSHRYLELFFTGFMNVSHGIQCHRLMFIDQAHVYPFISEQKRDIKDKT